MTDSANPILRGLHYAFYDWTREIPKGRRFLVWAGILIQGFAIYAGFPRPLIWPTGPFLIASVWLLYVLGGTLINAMLTWELKRKTQLEADQIAARRDKFKKRFSLETLNRYQVIRWIHSNWPAIGLYSHWSTHPGRGCRQRSCQPIYRH